MTSRLLSVNVGGPREIEWEGKTVRTAIWKEAVEGPRMVRRINIDGDDQADRLAHGGEHRAVFVYQIESYRYWERELGRSDFTYGQFGENLTVEGLPDDEVCIGDRYRIGEALFEVTQPRVTCYRVGIRMDEPAMPSLLVAHHRPGFYLRVLEEGAVQAGDAITKIADGPERLTIAEVDALLYLPNKSRALLERALRVPALSEGWKGSFRELLAKAEGGTPAPPAWTGFQPLRVAEVRRESATVTSFRLVPTDGAPRGRAPAGQYLTVRVQPDADAAAADPQLLAVGPPRRARLPDQRQARRCREPLPARAREGRRSARRRRPARQLRPARRHPSGRADERRRGRDPRARDAARPGARAQHEAGLVGARGAQPRRSRLRRRGRRAARRARRWPSRGGLQPAGRREARGSDYDVSGRLDARDPRSCRGAQGRRLLPVWTRGFMRAIGAALTARGVQPERVATEAFGAVAVHASGLVKAGERPPHSPEGSPGGGPTVTFVRSNLAIPWDDRYPSLLDFAEACDVPVGFGCRHGVCHNCESGLVAGAVTYTEEPLELPPEGRVLVCCTRPASELALDL